MEQIEMCTIACELFQQRMNSPKKGQYSGFCDARSGMIIFTEDVSKYDRYGTAKRFLCIAPEAKLVEENFWDNVDPFGWMTSPDD